MAIDVQCSDCHTPYSIDEQFVGKRVKCRHCGNIFQVGGSSGELPSAGSDPFENAVFETPAPRTAAPAKVYHNPIDTISVPKTPVEEAAPPGRGGINYASASNSRLNRSVGVDSASSYVLGVYLLGSIALGIYFSIQFYNGPLKSSMASAAVGQLWGIIAVSDVFFFLFIGTMTLLGIWATSKMMGFPLAGSSYMRACGVAALPGVVVYVCMLIPAPFNVLLLLASFPLTYYMLTLVFEVTWGQGAVAFLLGGIGWIIGNAVATFFLVIVLGASFITLKEKAHDEALKDERDKMLAQASPNNSGTANTNNNQYTPTPTPAPTPSPIPNQPAIDRTDLNDFAQVLDASMADVTKPGGPEKPTGVDVIKARLEHLRPRFQSDSAWPGLEQKVEAYVRAVKALPPVMIDPSTFADVPDSADDWTVGKLSRGKLAPEISFKQFKLQIPEDMKLDLNSGEDSADGLVWNGPNGQSQLRIALRPRQDPRQRRPLIAATSAIQRAAEEATLLAYDGRDVIGTVGQINSIPVTKIIVNPTSIGEKFTEYIAAVDNSWLIIHLLMPPDAANARVLDAAARTLRKIDDGEAKVDPLSAKYLASRLADDSEHAAPMLRAMGAKAEDALAALLKSDDSTQKRRALEILQDIATEKSLPALKIAAVDPDQTNATLARTAIRRISPAGLADTTPMRAGPPDNGAVVPVSPNAPPDPAKAADLQRALADLSGDDAARKKDAVGKLAFFTPTPRDRPAVLSKLAAMLRTRDASVPIADVVAALTQWGDASVGPELLPLLKQDTDAESRHAAMRVLGAVKCVKAAPAMVRWLKIDPIPTTDALIDMGSGAEPAVLPFLNDPDTTVNIDAARVLERIGTRKSVSDLTRVGKGDRDPGVRAAAQIALDAVNARLVDEKPAVPAAK